MWSSDKAAIVNDCNEKQSSAKALRGKRREKWSQCTKRGANPLFAAEAHAKLNDFAPDFVQGREPLWCKGCCEKAELRAETRALNAHDSDNVNASDHASNSDNSVGYRGSHSNLNLGRAQQPYCHGRMRHTALSEVTPRGGALAGS